MERIQCIPRDEWPKIIESQGMHYHCIDGEEFWDESAYYRFSSSQVDVLETATYELNKMCLAAVQYVIEENLFANFQIPPAFVEYVKASWQHDELAIYGRFDLAYDGTNPPKLLEFNADTPTALLEAAVIQWFWFKALHPDLDQFNSIHERLIEAWRRHPARKGDLVYFCCLAENLEDYMTTNYLRDTAMQAGLNTQFLQIEQIGWNASEESFVDLDERPMKYAFKLYPWEWMIREQFSPQLLANTMRWLEAPWKMILSNKAILPVLYRLFPNSPYLLEASTESLSGSFVRKPILSREGSNITVVEDGRTILETEGDYGAPYIYQRLYPLPAFDGNYPVVGSWLINGYACGIGIREDSTPVTRNTSRFVPHVFSH